MFTDKFKHLEAKGYSLHLEDRYGYQNYWKELTDLLCEDENETIHFLETCTLDEALTASEVLEKVSLRLKSNQFIECLRNLDKKYPEANLTDFIDSAESFARTKE